MIVGVAISAMLISSSIPVMAFSVTNGNKTFDKKWELSTTSDGGKGVLTYGYNTLAINEDYAHAYHSTKDHYAYVKNGNGSFSGSNVGKGNWSKIEVAHKGNSITYDNSYLTIGWYNGWVGGIATTLFCGVYINEEKNKIYRNCFGYFVLLL